MKQLLIGLLFPLVSFGQTVHHDEEKIIYRGTVAISAGATSGFPAKLQDAFTKVANDQADSVFMYPGEDSLKAYASIRMNSPYATIKKMHFVIQLKPMATGYVYTIDSVFVTEKRRGWKEKTAHSKELVEALEETGNAAIVLEVTLNEIDLRIQKLLRVLENEMKKKTVHRVQANSNAASQRNAER